MAYEYKTILRSDWVFFLAGIIKAKQLDYSEAHKNLIQAIRKAPQFSAIGFRQIVSSKYIVAWGGCFCVNIDKVLYSVTALGKMPLWKNLCQYFLFNFIVLHINDQYDATNDCSRLNLPKIYARKSITTYL